MSKPIKNNPNNNYYEFIVMNQFLKRGIRMGKNIEKFSIKNGNDGRLKIKSHRP